MRTTIYLIAIIAINLFDYMSSYLLVGTGMFIEVNPVVRAWGWGASLLVNACTWGIIGLVIYLGFNESTKLGHVAGLAFLVLVVFPVIHNTWLVMSLLG